MKKKLIVVILVTIFLVGFQLIYRSGITQDKSSVTAKKSHWFLLHRKSAIEYLYFGVPNDVNDSSLLKTFQVKTGNPGSSPTPLPHLLGRKYWVIVNKESSHDNPETAPYFLTLDVSAPSTWPFGPAPYMECRDTLTDEPIQCDWGQPGYFGLHGINTNTDKLSKDDKGSLGCIRHSDEDITYLYTLLSPASEEIRYYIEDI